MTREQQCKMVLPHMHIYNHTLTQTHSQTLTQTHSQTLTQTHSHSLHTHTLQTLTHTHTHSTHTAIGLQCRLLRRQDASLPNPPLERRSSNLHLKGLQLRGQALPSRIGLQLPPATISPSTPPPARMRHP